MITTITSTGERHKNRQTKSSRRPSSSSAKWSESPPPLESHLIHLIYHYHIQDAEQELPQLANKLRSQELSSVPAIAEGFRLAYALTLLRYMLH